MVLPSVGLARLRSEVGYLQFGHRGLWAGQRQGAFPGHATHSGNENTSIKKKKRICTDSHLKGWFSQFTKHVWISLFRCCFRSCVAPTAACWTWLPSHWVSSGGWRCHAQGWTLALGRVWPPEAWHTAPPPLPPIDLRALDPKTTRPPCTTWSSCVCSSSPSAGLYFRGTVSFNLQLIRYDYLIICFCLMSFIDLQHLHCWPMPSSSRWVRSCEVPLAFCNSKESRINLIWVRISNMHTLMN